LRELAEDAARQRAIFPRIDLRASAIQYGSNTKRGESVYEPFLGSGTTLAVAEITERVCYGIELDPKYVDVVVKRCKGSRSR
jgi:DNA methylase